MAAEPLLPIADMNGALYALLHEQYKNPRADGSQSNVARIIEMLAGEAQLLELAWQELLPLLNVDACEGTQLDVLGRICGVARSSMTDTAYRVAIKAAFQRNDSGTPEQIIATVKAATGSTKVWYIPEYPAGYWIICDGYGLTRELLELISPAGVLAFPFCYLSDAEDNLIRTATGDPILVVGPCENNPYPTDRVWDAGIGAAGAGTLAEAWPFRDGTGIGQHPDAGVGPIDPQDYTFQDGTFAENP